MESGWSQVNGVPKSGREPDGDRIRTIRWGPGRDRDLEGPEPAGTMGGPRTEDRNLEARTGQEIKKVRTGTGAINKREQETGTLIRGTQRKRTHKKGLIKRRQGTKKGTRTI